MKSANPAALWYQWTLWADGPRPLRNILVPILIYVVTFPLTYRAMQYQMGHAYELQVPRGRKEWETALQVQRDFPTSVGCALAAAIKRSPDTNTNTQRVAYSAYIPLYIPIHTYTYSYISILDIS